MNERAIPFYPEDDRRSITGFNRLRRFLNNYWLLPLIICYLQLATQVIYPADSPLDRLTKGNRAFLQGVPIAYEILTRDFPFTLLGHFYELSVQGLYKAELFQVAHEDIKSALNNPEIQQKLYDKLITSRSHHDSEIGGLLSVSYQEGQPVLHLHEVSSLNERYLQQLRHTRNSPSDFIHLIQSKDNKELLEGVGIQANWVESTSGLVQSTRITEGIREIAIKNFIEMYEALSESRYILSPYQFKEALGKIPFGERFVGIFHFHNGLNEPPSATDIQQSQRNRQIVLTFSNSGWTLYDIHKQELAKVDIKIDNPVVLQ